MSQSRARAGEGRAGWLAGYGGCLSDLWRVHHDAQMIRHIMVSNGITLRQLELAGVDERDLSIVRRAFLGEEG